VSESHRGWVGSRSRYLFVVMRPLVWYGVRVDPVGLFSFFSSLHRFVIIDQSIIPPSPRWYQTDHGR